MCEMCSLKKGPNGAGKTTTINIITTDLSADSGSVNICGEDLSLKNLKAFYENVGFCPQNNPFWEELTLREHLALYACIKDIPEESIIAKCDEYMENLDIMEHADKQTKYLSGGTKRKLAFAMAMLNSPKIALLDGIFKEIF